MATTTLRVALAALALVSLLSLVVVDAVDARHAPPVADDDFELMDATNAFDDDADDDADDAIAFDEDADDDADDADDADDDADAVIDYEQKKPKLKAANAKLKPKTMVDHILARHGKKATKKQLDVLKNHKTGENVRWRYQPTPEPVDPRHHGMHHKEVPTTTQPWTTSPCHYECPPQPTCEPWQHYSARGTFAEDGCCPRMECTCRGESLGCVRTPCAANGKLVKVDGEFADSTQCCPLMRCVYPPQPTPVPYPSKCPEDMTCPDFDEAEKAHENCEAKCMRRCVRSQAALRLDTDHERAEKFLSTCAARCPIECGSGVKVPATGWDNEPPSEDEHHEYDNGFDGVANEHQLPYSNDHHHHHHHVHEHVEQQHGVQQQQQQHDDGFGGDAHAAHAGHGNDGFEPLQPQHVDETTPMPLGQHEPAAAAIAGHPAHVDTHGGLNIPAGKEPEIFLGDSLGDNEQLANVVHSLGGLIH